MSTPRPAAPPPRLPATTTIAHAASFGQSSLWRDAVARAYLTDRHCREPGRLYFDDDRPVLVPVFLRCRPAGFEARLGGERPQQRVHHTDRILPRRGSEDHLASLSAATEDVAAVELGRHYTVDGE